VLIVAVVVVDPRCLTAIEEFPGHSVWPLGGDRHGLGPWRAESATRPIADMPRLPKSSLCPAGQASVAVGTTFQYLSTRKPSASHRRPPRPYTTTDESKENDISHVQKSVGPWAKYGEHVAMATLGLRSRSVTAVSAGQCFCVSCSFCISLFLVLCP